MDVRFLFFVSAGYGWLVLLDCFILCFYFILYYYKNECGIGVEFKICVFYVFDVFVDYYF